MVSGRGEFWHDHNGWMARSKVHGRWFAVQSFVALIARDLGL